MKGASKRAAVAPAQGVTYRRPGGTTFGFESVTRLLPLAVEAGSVAITAGRATSSGRVDRTGIL